MLDFSGIWVPLVTPFQDRAGGGDGTADEPAVDTAALTRLTGHLASQGAAGFVACGSTGEAAMLDEAEQAAVLGAAIEGAGGKPVLMGLSGVRPARVAARARELARDFPVAGYLVCAPAYVKPDQAGLLDFFTTVADASPVPIVVYDIPGRTAVRIATETLLALAGHPRIRAVKDCSADPDAALAMLRDGRLALLAGNDDELFAQLALGAPGAIAASAHLRPDLFVRLHALLRDQQLHAAQALWRALRPLTKALFAEPNPAPVKGALARQGLIGPALRAPMRAASADTLARVDAVLARLEADWPI
jgi:4-hydroxy-tetrahydrodipicolinate synthase